MIATAIIMHETVKSRGSNRPTNGSTRSFEAVILKNSFLRRGIRSKASRQCRI
jgi:hypothetical protein